ncbi:MAG TPA: aminotransferase class I/II-fold pyridoxal phosphate-dependent enzyme [Longimicrobiales bacterium]|nr:aminotransferase class I/II-fold pyridoxal phosphate-dependent enzyme [Longimicrobiales bacterium]
MDRRGFVTTGMAASLAGLGGLGSAAPLLDRTGFWRVGKTLADGTVRLSSNENPLGLAPSARQAVVDAIVNANRYPGEWSAPVQAAIAKRLGVANENVVLGAGSTEILQMAVQAFPSPRAPLVLAEPTYEDVPRYRRPFAYEMITVPLGAGMVHDLGRMREAAEKGGRPALVYICNPNNPTGTVTPSREVDAWIADAPETTMFLVDEAYFEYVNDPAYWTALKWVGSKPNVIVARTFSKIYGMAGIRLGYGVAHPDTAGRLRDFICANNINVLASAAATASMADEGLVARGVKVNSDAKAIAVGTLDDLGLEHLPTQTNFIMHRINGDLQAYIGRMREQGIRVGRPFPPMTEWNRVSFGLPDEMERWADALRGMRAVGHI